MVEMVMTAARAEALRDQARRWLQRVRDEFDALEAQEKDRHFAATRHGMQYAQYVACNPGRPAA